MNAVKRCLALLAATLVVGACGSDQTADRAGTDLTIRATPGAIWMRDNVPATFIIEAVDKLGGPAQGSWTVDSIDGPMEVDYDSTYLVTSTGGVGTAAKFVVTSSAEGDGSVVITGTGGWIKVPIRIAPDTTAFHAVANDSSPALFQAITLTAPEGIAFTNATTVRFFSGTQARDTSNGGLSFPVVQSVSADSSQLTFVPGPGAKGQARLTNLVSRSTPGLTSFAKTEIVFAQVPVVDTAAFSVTPTFRLTGNRTMPSVFDTLVITAPAGYVFLPSATIQFWRLTADPNTGLLTVRTVSNGTATPVKISVKADSTEMRWAVAPGTRGRLQVNKIAFRNENGIRFNVNGPSTETFDLRSGVNGPDTTAFAITFNKTSPVAEGDTVTATAPAGMVFRPGTVMINAGASGTPSGGDSARVVDYGADSTTVRFILPPGASGKFRYSAIARRDIPGIVWSGRSATTISAAAAPAVVATVTPGTANMNDTVTVALDPAGPYRFRPASVAQLGGFTGMVASISADSLTMKVFVTPGFTGPLTLTNIRYANLPTFQVVAATAASVTANAPTSLGQDDPEVGAVPIFGAPDSGKVVGWWDQATFTAADYSPDGGVTGMYYRITSTKTHSVNFKVDWSQNGPDVDFILLEDNGAYDTPVGNVTSGAASGHPENATYALVSGKTYILAIIDFRGTAPAILNTNAIKVTMVGQ